VLCAIFFQCSVSLFVYFSWSDDERTLFTASRDGTCKIWRVEMDPAGGGVNVQPMGSFSAFSGVAVTSLDCISPVGVAGNAVVLACGSENGDISVFKVNDPSINMGGGATVAAGSNLSLLHSTKPNWSHGSTVRRLKWSRAAGDVDYDYILASCGDDNCVRIFDYKRM
jgi:elongator complex protein 2